jgi:serine/threonine protein kinase
MWAVGYILYELILRRRAFEDDWNVLQYANRGRELELILEPEIVPDERRREFLSRINKELLDINPSRRPSARTLYERFISWGSDNATKSILRPAFQLTKPDTQLLSVALKVPTEAPERRLDRPRESSIESHLEQFRRRTKMAEETVTKRRKTIGDDKIDTVAKRKHRSREAISLSISIESLTQDTSGNVDVFGLDFWLADHGIGMEKAWRIKRLGH